MTKSGNPNPFHPCPCVPFSFPPYPTFPPYRPFPGQGLPVREAQGGQDQDQGHCLGSFLAATMSSCGWLQGSFWPASSPLFGSYQPGFWQLPG